MFSTQSAWSLGRRLALIAAFAMGLVIVFGGLAMYWAAAIEDEQMLDARLEQLGATVLAFVENGLTAAGKDVLSHSPPLATRPAAALLYRYQVWSSEGKLLLRSYEAPSDRPMLALTHSGFETVSFDGEAYRTFSLPSKDRRVIVQVGECLDERVAQVATVTAYYVGFLFLPIGILFGTTWLLLRRSMRSINSIALQLTQRNPLDVACLRVENPPIEILPILSSLDTLFARVRQALSVERRFTSVAAHEMRTPLAGLRAHAQLACSARTPEESREALGQVVLGVDRAAHMLDQLLDIARIEGLGHDGGLPVQPIAIEVVFGQVLDVLALQAAAKNIAITAKFDAPFVQGLSFGIYLVVRNLMVNAILYCPERGRIHVSSRTQAGSFILSVEDSGRGIPVEDRDRAFERFNRLGQNKSDGVGLGLSIVLMVVDQHGAKIRLCDSDLGGLRAELVFAHRDLNGATETPLQALAV